jgi:hypothetical protein
MARSDQIARQQRRAFCIFRDSTPGTVIIDATSYEVAVAPGTAEHDIDDGVVTTPQAIGFWISKDDHPTKPATRTRVTWNGTDYFIDSVQGDGANFQQWKVDASRHRP